MSKRPEDGQAFGAAPHERPVPRISIHAFCEFPDTGAALQRAGADRRLSKAHLTVQLGGINAAVEFYNGQVTPNLLVVETRLHGQAALDELDRLAAVCDPATKVVVVGRTNDVELYRELMRRGASEYLVAPLAPLQLIEVISGLYLDPGAPSHRRVPRRYRRHPAISAPRPSPIMWAGASPRNCTSTPPSWISICLSALWAWISTTKRGRASPMRSPRAERLDDVLLVANF